MSDFSSRLESRKGELSSLLKALYNDDSSLENLILIMRVYSYKRDEDLKEFF